VPSDMVPSDIHDAFTLWAATIFSEEDLLASLGYNAKSWADSFAVAGRKYKITAATQLTRRRAQSQILAVGAVTAFDAVAASCRPIMPQTVSKPKIL
jgi:hypothetical protein